MLFETVVNKLTQKPEAVHKAKSLDAYIHKYESNYGELTQIRKLETRMAELFPDDPKLGHFSARFSTDKFDPIAARIIVSPATQLRPKQGIMASIERGMSLQRSPSPPPRGQSVRPALLQAVNSPKRPFPGEDFDDNPPRKMQRSDQHEFQRGVSPLKGAAGRRLDQQRRMQGHGGGASSQNAAPLPLARDITFLLSLIPNAASFNSQRYKPNEIVRILREAHIPDYATYKSRRKDEHPSLRGGLGQAHKRQASGEHGQYGYQNRESPNPQNRPASPYGRLAPTHPPYRQSSLRPGSSGSYEPPPAVHAQQGPPPPQYGQSQPPPPGQFEGGAWPPSFPPPSFAPPPTMGYAQTLPPPPPQQQQQQPYHPPYRY